MIGTSINSFVFMFLQNIPKINFFHFIIYMLIHISNCGTLRICFHFSVIFRPIKCTRYRNYHIVHLNIIAHSFLISIYSISIPGSSFWLSCKIGHSSEYRIIFQHNNPITLRIHLLCLRNKWNEKETINQY